MARTQTRARGAGGAVLKRILIGRQKPSHQLEHQRLPKVLALPIFASDALSSNAYATEQILLILLTASATGAHAKVLPIALVISALLAVVVFSYTQICRAYPGGGGGYVVTKDTLGTIPSLVAGAALLVDLVLTVAVSVVAGVVAIVSYEPSLLRYTVPLALGFVVLLTLANLRGVRESGALFAIPTYLFILAILTMIGVGAVQCLGGCPQAEPVPPLDRLAQSAGLLSMFVLLHAFSSGATALTGVEAIATAVPAFKRPQSVNAQKTLVMLGVLAIAMFVGISYLAGNSGVTVSEHRSVVAQVAHTVFGGGIGFLLVQVFTTLILVFAANTAYQAFPRLLAILANDRIVPRRFAALGDRLVFSNGIILLALAAGLLVWVFQANLDRLIQLYVVGVFTDFTLSQTGMIKRWLRVRRAGGPEARGWQYRITANAVGAVCTAAVLVVTVLTKFVEGAWIVVVAIPLIVLFLGAINRHYLGVERQLRTRASPVAKRPENHVVLLVPDTGPATAEALGFLRSIRPASLRAMHIGDRTGDGRSFEAEWHDFARGTLPLDLPPPNGDMLERVRLYVRDLPRGPDDFVTVVVPELVSGGSIGYLLRRPGLIRLKAGLLRERGIVVADVPVHVDGGDLVGVDGRPLVPRRTVALVLVAGVHDATARAVRYARSLRASETRAVSFLVDPAASAGLQRDWFEQDFDVPLDLVQAPFRELREPLLEEVRRYTREEGTVLIAVMPELLAARWWQAPLHNQTALLVKRALLFEPRVILSSVPYQLE